MKASYDTNNQWRSCGNNIRQEKKWYHPGSQSSTEKYLAISTQIGAHNIKYQKMKNISLADRPFGHGN